MLVNKHAGRRLHCPNSISLCCLPAIESWREIPTEMVLEVHSASHRLRHRIARGGGECGAGWGQETEENIDDSMNTLHQ